MILSTQASNWDCRWPDPVALKVATDRLLAGRPPDDPSLNRSLGVTIRMEPPEDPQNPISALLVSPWAVERVFWHHQPNTLPPIIHAADLELDPQGRVTSGQGVILETKNRTFPVVIHWEPETGHHFIQTLLPQVLDMRTLDEAIRHALGTHSGSLPQSSLSNHLHKKVSRRGLMGLPSLLSKLRG
ncbi:MAG: hypothetical protein HW380_2904 [Magnetococcales bacterium]|nr:hypothetical protein [Magnetococcales bacterium]HIJ84817.1 hypothetical protein [Magnetococcales bacterium]